MDYSKESNKKRRRSAVSKTKKSRNRIVTIAFRVIVSVALVSIFAAGGVAFGAYMGIIDSIAHIDYRAGHMAVYESSIVFDRYGNEIDRFLAHENREFVLISQIPQHVQDAFIAIEDQRFFEHNGVDLRGTARAIYVTLTSPRSEGGSTITQQLVKNNIMRLHANTPETKLQEIFLALRLEASLTADLGRDGAKMHILEQYLNTINLGGQLHGVQSAALFYFNKDIEDITLSEAAVLASITQHPVRYNPARNPHYNRLRQVTVLNRMLAQGFITQAEFNYAYNDPVFDRISEFSIQREETGNIRSYFMDHVFNVLVEDLIESGLAATRVDAGHIIHNHGLRIYTTKNPYIQNIIEEVYLDDSFFPAHMFEISIEYHVSFREHPDSDEILHRSVQNIMIPNMYHLEERLDQLRYSFMGDTGVIIAERYITTPQPQSAFVVIDHNTGQVHGLVGGRGEKTANLAFNRATEGRRHPGSVFKMIASYAPAFDLGLLSPGATLLDQPLAIPSGGQTWSPENWQQHFRGNNSAGRVNVRRAVAESFNRVAAYATFYMVGVDRAFDYVRNFGFDLPDTDRIPSIALGGLTEGVTQLEMATAFGAIANGGILIEPTFYTRVYNHAGTLLLEANPEVRQVMRPQSAYLLTNTMVAVLTQGTGGAARLNTNMAVAGKTGTSQESRDINFAGYTPHFTATIWFGHDQPRTLSNHNNAHLRIWSTIMNRIHEEVEAPIITSFNRPTGITTAQICLDSGLLAIPGICTHVQGGSRVVTDLFDSTFGPRHQCNVHGVVRIDTLTGLPVTGDTPLYRQENIVTEIDPVTGLPIVPEIEIEEDFYDYFNQNDDDVFDIEGLEEDPVYELVEDEWFNPDFSDIEGLPTDPMPPAVLPDPTWPPIPGNNIDTSPPTSPDQGIVLPGGNIPATGYPPVVADPIPEPEPEPELIIELPTPVIFDEIPQFEEFVISDS